MDQEEVMVPKLDDIIVQTGLVKLPGHFPERIVLRRWKKNEYVTHMQVAETAGSNARVSYHHGHYFSGEHSLQRALQDFTIRAHNLFAEAEFYGL